MEDKTLENFFGRNFAYDNKKIKIYHDLQNGALSPFKGKTLADIFFYAAVLGFRNRRKESLSDARPNIWVDAVNKPRKAMLISIVVSDAGDIDVLFDPEKAKTVLEEYANAGIDMIKSDLLGDSSAEPIERMSFMMKEILNRGGSSGSESA